MPPQAKETWDKGKQATFVMRLINHNWNYEGIDGYGNHVFEMAGWRIVIDDWGIWVFNSNGERIYGLCDEWCDNSVTSLFPLIYHPFTANKRYDRLYLKTGVLERG